MDIKKFLKRKNIEITVKRYLVDALGAMALGLFSSLIIGSILNIAGGKLGIEFFTKTLWPIAASMTGPSIGIAVAWGLQAPPLVLFASAATGAAGAAAGGPVGAFIAAVVGAEFGKLVSKETKVDIIVTPAVTMITGIGAGTFAGPSINSFMTGFGEIVMYSTELHPFFMGTVVSVLMGIALTLPISSAAIAMMLGLGGLAGGAATVGCCAQMVGFAVMSFKENGWGGLTALGFGTSMLQFPNIVKNWKIWIPPIIASALLGPLATVVFKMQNTPAGSGMGTSGLVGSIETYAAMDKAGRGGMEAILLILLLQMALPAVITLVISSFMKRKGYIKDGDLKIRS